MSNKCMIIAELSANHDCDIEIAKETIRAAKRAGADAIKLQTYTPDTMTLKCQNEDFVVKGGTLWDGRLLHELYQNASLPWEWHAELFDLAKSEGLICFSTPFDISAVEFLEDLNCPIYKIASFEIQDIPLIAHVAKKNKPIIISTGIASYEDIKLALDTIRNNGNEDITVLKCTSSYPAPIDEANILLMKKFSNDFNVKVGLSDHTMSNIVPIMAIANGAQVIEKHFKLNDKVGGADAAFSLNEQQFKSLVDDVRIAEKALGNVTYKLTKKQISGKRFGRSIYISKDINKGEILSEKNIRVVRPGLSLHPKYYTEIIGKKINKNLSMGSRLNLNDIQNIEYND